MSKIETIDSGNYDLLKSYKEAVDYEIKHLHEIYAIGKELQDKMLKNNHPIIHDGTISKETLKKFQEGKKHE